MNVERGAQPFRMRLLGGHRVARTAGILLMSMTGIATPVACALAVIRTWQFRSPTDTTPRARRWRTDLMALRVTVEDIETGQKGERIVPEGDYILVTADPCYLAGTQTYAKTHVLTIKGFTTDARATLAMPAAPASEADRE